MVGEKGTLTPRENMGNISPSGAGPAGNRQREAITPSATKYSKKSLPFLGELEQSAVIGDCSSVLIAIRATRLSIIATARTISIPASALFGVIGVMEVAITSRCLILALLPASRRTHALPGPPSGCKS